MKPIETSEGFLRKKLTWVVSLVAALAAVAFGVEKTVEYAAPPIRDKDCTYTYPHTAAGTAANTTATDTTTVAAAAAADRLLAPTFVQLGGTMVDASCLDRTAIHGIARITSVDDVAAALRYARETGLQVTSAGRQHSMGGQSFSRGGLVLDMKGLAGMTLDKDARVLHVESGATWAKVQELLDAQGLSVKAMQSINIFTVGGTLSVNAHGIAHNPGQVATTVRSLRVMRADGSVVTASPTENADLFHHVLGGYGLFGVILSADLDVVPNEVYAWSIKRMAYTDFPAYYAQHIEDNPDLGLVYGRLSVADEGYLSDTTIHVYSRTAWNQPIPALRQPSLTWCKRLVINFSKIGSLGRKVRWLLERYVEPRTHACVSRNTAMGDDVVCDVSRNQEMYDPMGYLKNRLPDTDILQEYFIPPEKMPAFVDALRDTVRRNGANLLNVTIRIVHKDETTALPYAKGDRLAFVLYFNQRFNDRESEILRQTTVELIDAAIAQGGTFYLPYQLYYSDAQLRAAYPEVDAFFATKRGFDPDGLFTNEWYERYGK